MLVGVQLSVIGLYLPPVFSSPMSWNPPQIISSLPVHTDLSLPRASGALVVLVAVHVSSAGLDQLRLIPILPSHHTVYLDFP